MMQLEQELSIPGVSEVEIVSPEGADPRRTVRQICRLNGLRESTIFPQDRLLIPTE